jgi:hypothetical protein
MKKLILATVCTLAFSAAAQATDLVCRFTNIRDGSHSLYLFGPNTESGDSGTFVEKDYWHEGRVRRIEQRGIRPVWTWTGGDDVTVLRPLSESDDGGWEISVDNGSDDAELIHFGRTIARGLCSDRRSGPVTDLGR